MKSKLFCLGVALITGSFANAQEAQNDYTKEFRRLVWGDEFNYRGAPDSAKWVYEEGFVRNKEEQYYTKNRRQNCRVEDGNLIIEAHKELFQNKFYQANNKDWRKEKRSAEYTSASIHTMDRAVWGEFRVEVRAKLPTGKGVWPAIWMLGENSPDVGWPKCGEIDIMEYVTSSPNVVHSTVHWFNPKSEKDPKEKKNNSQSSRASVKPDEFHVYAMEKTNKTLTFFVDGKKHFEFKIDEAGKGSERVNNPFLKPFYLKLNLAMGGGWGGKIDPEALPQSFIVDYVRVYQK